MNDGGWTIGLLTLIAMAFGVAAFVRAVKPLVNSPSPRTEPQKPDYRKAMAMQSKQAAMRSEGYNSLTRDQWLHRAAMRIVQMWSSVEYDTAIMWIKEWIADCDMVFGDAAHEWTYESAVEMADIYMRENGETYGSNT